MKSQRNITDLLPKRARPYAKTVVTTLVVFIGGVLAFWDNGVTTREWLEIALLTLGGGGSAYGARNDLNV